MKKENINYDEIDLKELTASFIRYKYFIIIFTFVFTTIAYIYLYTKTPIYEVMSVIRIGYIGDRLVEDNATLEKKLRLVFNVDSKKNIIEENKAIVSNINSVKKANNFVEIYTQAFSNEKAFNKNKEVLAFLQNEYKPVINEFILKTEINIQNIEENIDYINSVDKINTQKEIEKIKNQSIPKINEKINLIKKQDIAKINKKIYLIKNIELKSLDNKINFNEKKLDEYEKVLEKISKEKSQNNTENMLMAMQMINTQNLILNVQNTIENLKKEKENLENITLKDLENKKDILLNVTIKDLQLQKLNLINENIRKLQIKLDIDLENKISDLKSKLQLEKLKLTNNNVKNSEIVGNIQINDYPIKPRKNLILLVAFVTGFILAIFLILIFDFYKKSIKQTPLGHRNSL